MRKKHKPRVFSTPLNAVKQWGQSLSVEEMHKRTGFSKRSLTDALNEIKTRNKD